MTAAIEDSENVLECRHLTKRFGGLAAVQDVQLSIKAGERRAIIGPNGAGKTTLFALISGLLRVSSGSIWLNQKDITRLPSHQRTYLGLARTFQITNLFPTLSVVDNLVMAAMGLKKMKFSMLRGLNSYRALYERADQVLEQIGLMEKRDEEVRNLSHGQQRQVEVSLPLVCNPTVMLLDEPTSGLSSAEAAIMSGVIQKLESKITLLIIEHNMDVALKVAHQITVMHLGTVFAEGSTDEIRNSKAVQDIYLGSENQA